MRVSSLKLSNILSFKYYDNIEDATELKFDNDLNIIIGENGSGKSTALEVINFFFKKVIFRSYKFEPQHYSHTQSSYRKNTLRLTQDNETYKEYYRLDPNWDTTTKKQFLSLKLNLDEIDKHNVQILVDNLDKIKQNAEKYTNRSIQDLEPIHGNEKVEINVELDNENNSFTVSHNISANIFSYLEDYELFRELIRLHNIENPKDTITTLDEPFAILTAFRNYHSFGNTVSLAGNDAYEQIRQIRTGLYNKGFNTREDGEPSIFSIVRLRVANDHYDKFEEKSNKECEEEANNLDFLKTINDKLSIVNLKCRVKLKNKRTWEYSFEFVDTKRNKVLGDINALSAGQKSIIHLIFEAYGRGEIKGGVVIIDEPEIHLHYQFQHEYLQVVEDISRDQKVQYILVTHSESLINHKTIKYVKRFSLDKERHSVINQPTISESQRVLVKILDNTRSANALFGKKIVLVEGEDDRYFFRALLNETYPELNQEISIFDVGGKGKSFEDWKNFFEGFGLTAYQIQDLDASFGILYPEETFYSLKESKNPGGKANFLSSHPNLHRDIESKYTEKLYILKQGELEDYLGTPNKGLEQVIKFCNEEIEGFLKNKEDEKATELIRIIEEIKQ